MANAISILGVGQVSACGSGVEGLRDALQIGSSTPEWVAIPHARTEMQVPVLRARPGDLERLAPSRLIRRLDAFAQKFVEASLLAVRDVGAPLPSPERIGVVIATGYGSIATSFSLLDEIIDGGDDAGSAISFAVSVNNAPATSISALLDARGPVLAVTGFDHPVVNALRVAQEWLASDRVDVVVMAAGDEYHPIIGYGLSHGEGWAADGIIRPFEYQRCTFVPGETFAAFVLARDSARAPYGRIVGFKAFADLAGQYSPCGEALLMLVADGRLETVRMLSALAAGHQFVCALTPLWGGNPTADAMTLAAAAVMLRDGSVPPWCGDGRPLTIRQVVAVASATGGKRYSVVTLMGAHDDGRARSS